MAGYDGGNAPVADRKLGDMTSEEFQERGMMDVFAQVQGVLQEHPELTAGALAQITALGSKKNEEMSKVPDDDLKKAGLMDGAGNLLASVRRKMQENPKLTIAAALAAAGLAVAAGVYAYKKFASDETPIADVSNEELGERGLLDSSGNMLESVKTKMAENPKMTVAAALAAVAATGVLIVGGIALSRKFSADSTPVADLPKDELQQRGLLDATGGMLDPVKAAVADHPKLTVAAALAATGLVVAGGVALHHSSSADTPAADMTDEQLQEVGLADDSGGLLSSIKDKIKANPKMSVAAALAAAAAIGLGAYAVHHAMNKPDRSGKGKKGKKGKEGKEDKGGKDKKEKEKKDKGGKEKKEKGGKEKKEKGGGKKDKKKGKTKDLPGVGTRGIFHDPTEPDDDDTSSSDSSEEEN